MKRNWKNKFTSWAIPLIVFVALACNKPAEHAEHADTYTCPMHPSVISDRPGTCPVCGMDLVRKARPGEAVEITEDLARLMKSPNETVVAAIKTIKGEFKSAQVNIEVEGVVTYDTRNLFTIPARIGGRLEKVYLKHAFQEVKRGQKVAEIYSPELLTAQRELLFLLENDAQNESLIKSATEKLQLLGASASQINTLIHRKEPQQTFSIYSPDDGYLISASQATPAAPLTSANSSSSASAGMGNGMERASSSTMPGTAASGVGIPENIIQEGSYVNAGQTLFKIVNTSALRIELNLPSTAMATVKKGTEVALDFGVGEQQDAVVDFIQPFFTEGQPFATVRAYTTNVDKLHIGHLVKARLTVSSIEALWVPREAVLDLGVDHVVFIKDKKVLKAKKVTIGIKTDHEVEIRQGLSSTDEIAANAQFLVDSESLVKTQQ